MRGTDPRHLFLYGDHLGSTVQVRDGDGKSALRLGYSPFGQVFLKHSDRNHWSPSDGSASALEQLGNLMPYQYTGRYTKASTGLVHLDARWYNPQTQRFMQPDFWNFRNTGVPMEVRHELMRFTKLDTAQLLRDPGQQVGYGYVSGNPLAWNDLLGLSECKPSFWQKLVKILPPNLRLFGAIANEVAGEYTVAVGPTVVFPTTLFGGEYDTEVQIDLMVQSLIHNDGPAIGFGGSVGAVEGVIDNIPSGSAALDLTVQQGNIQSTLEQTTSLNLQAGQAGGSILLNENNEVVSGGPSIGEGIEASVSSTAAAGAIYLDTNPPYFHVETSNDD